MPNHVINLVTLRGDEKRIAEMLDAIKVDEVGRGSIDFNKIVPMPEALNITAGSKTNEGLQHYKDFVSVYKTEILTPIHKDWNEDLIFSQKEGEQQWTTQLS